MVGVVDIANIIEPLQSIHDRFAEWAGLVVEVLAGFGMVYVAVRFERQERGPGENIALACEGSMGCRERKPGVGEPERDGQPGHLAAAKAAICLIDLQCPEIR